MDKIDLHDNKHQETARPIDRLAVERQLDKILVSDPFSKLRRLKAILSYVVEETLAGRQSSIKESTVGARVFGREPSSSPDDPIVRVSIGRLRRALDEYYENGGAGDPIRINIPKGSYVPEFSPLEERRKGRSLHNVRLPRVAVRPFVNHGESNGDDFFADALGEEVSIQLARFQDLAVLAYWTTSRASEASSDVLALSRDLKADFVVCGSIARSANRVRISVECIDIASAVQVWSQRFEMELTLENLFDILDQIVNRVVACVGDELGTISRSLHRGSIGKTAEALSVYEAVLASHHYVRFLDHQTHAYTRAALERAVEDEPSYALPWALLGALYCDIHAFELSELDAPLRHAERCVSRALSLDPECQHAHYSSGAIGLLTRDHPRIVDAADNILRLNPNAAYMVGAVSVWLGIAGYFERASALFEVSLELNPYHPGWFYFLPWLHAFTGKDNETALVAARRINTPLNFWDPLVRAATLGKLGRTSEAAAACDELIALKPEFAERHDHFLGCYVHADDTRRDVLDGLRLAGLKPIA